MQGSLAALHRAVAARDEAAIHAALWGCVQAWEGETFRTASGLPFSYRMKCGKHGAPTAELVITRKGESKTLTKSSVMYALGVVLEDMQYTPDGVILPRYKGPKAIGQIFGISYVYSLFWSWGLIAVPPKVEEKMKQQ